MAKKLKWNLILMSLLYLALGIFLLMVPGTALNVVCYALGGVVLACAAVQLVRYFVVERGVFQSQLTLISGLVCLALGAFLIIRSDIVVRVLPIVFGLFIIFDSLGRVQNALELRRCEYSSWKVFLLLAVCTVLVLAGVDEGFLYHDGQVELGGALAFVYTVCILIAVSMVVMIRMVFIHPLQRNIEAMKKLANGDFTVRVNHAEHGYVPREMVEFEQSFNKAAEELGGTEILRKDFINNFSHEFKTPIVSISGFADLLLEEQLPPEDQKEYLTIIRDESRRLADLATNILTLNRVESQTILTDKACFSLDEQLRQSVLVTQQKWRQKELDFDADLVPAEYTGSEGLLKEVWLNLLDNAAKFSPEGGTVAVNLRKAKNALMVSVTDQGEGMSADTQAHIFEQFYQGDTSHTTQGNGLGLAMVKKVLELHGGSIQVNSAPGQGSCFTVTLPI